MLMLWRCRLSGCWDSLLIYDPWRCDIMGRPLVAFAIFFAATMAAIAGGGFWLGLAVPAVVFVLMPLPVWDSGQRSSLLVCVVAGFLAALALWGLFSHRLQQALEYQGSAFSFTGYVAEADPYRAGRVMVRAETQEAGSLTIWLQSYTEDGLEEGDWLSGTAYITGARADGRAFLSLGVTVEATAGDLTLISPPERGGFLWRAAAVRRQLSDQMAAKAPGEGSALLSGLLFSRQSLLSDDARTALSRTGTGHILAVSGLHLSVAVSWVLWVCRRMGRSEKAALLPALAVVVLVVAMAGFRGSVLRAAVMTTLWLLGRAFGRRSDSLTSLAASGFLLVAVCPPALWDVGFWMSVMSVLGITTLATPISSWLCSLWQSRTGHLSKRVESVAGAIAVPMAGQLALMPIMLLEYGYFPLYSIPANMAISLLVWPALLLGALAAVGLFLFPGLATAELMLMGAAGLCKAILAICEFFARLPGGIFSLQHPHRWLVALLVPLVVAFCARRHLQAIRLRRVMAVALVFCIAVTIGGDFYYSRRTVVTADQWGTVVIKQGRNVAVLYEGSGDYDQRMLEQLLLRTGCDGLELQALVRPEDTTAESDYSAALVLDPVTMLVPPERLWEGLPRELTSTKVLAWGKEPVTLWQGTTLSSPGPYRSWLSVRGQKILKCWAGYGIITEVYVPSGTNLLVDLAGNFYSPGGDVTIWQLWTGDSVAVLD